MNRLNRAVALSIISGLLASGALYAQDDHRDDHSADHHDADHRDNHAYVEHKEWRRGYHMRHEDWDRGEKIDYHTYHLKAPPRGYEWREVDGNYVLAAVATGVIASVIAASVAH